jgi:hypothetical protein
MITCDDCTVEDQCVDCAAAESTEAWYTAMEMFESPDLT